jgi:ribosomal protein L29
MKAIDKKTVQTKSIKELKKQVEELQKTLAQLKLDHTQNKLKNTRSIFHTRKEIAVLQSVLHVKMKEKEGESGISA